MQYGASVNPSTEYSNANSHHSPSVSSHYGGYIDPRTYTFGPQTPMNPNGFSHTPQLQHNGGAFTTQVNPLMYTQAMYATNPSLGNTMHYQNSGLFNNPPSASAAVLQATTQPESQPSRPPKNDEDALVNALIVGRNSGLSDRQAIQRLHMVSSITLFEPLIPRLVRTECDVRRRMATRRMNGSTIFSFITHPSMLRYRNTPDQPSDLSLQR